MKKYNIKVDGVSYEVEVEEVYSDTLTESAPVKAEVKAAPPTPKAVNVASKAAGANSLKSPMPGTILKINCAAGSSVKKGDVLIVLEAMKMENDITAPQDTVIASVNCTQGSSVNTGDVLLTF